MALPLEGIVVVDLTQNVAGPFCTQILGDMGADVIKIERPGRGDDARAWAPPFWGDESATFMAFNRNKRSLALDLKHDGALEILKRLVARGDVFVQSLRAGVVDELGLDFARASTINPRLIYCSVTAFGTSGPLADQPGYDALSLPQYGGAQARASSPGPGRSILITSAPMSPRICVQKGPATFWVRSATTMPSNGSATPGVYHPRTRTSRAHAERDQRLK